SGRVQKDINPAELIQRFIRSKSAPMTGLIWSFLDGQSFIGEPIEDYQDSLNLIMESTIPLFIQDLMEAYEQQGLSGLAAATPGLIGGSIVAYDDTLAVVGEVHQTASYYDNLDKEIKELYKELTLKRAPQAEKIKKVQEFKAKYPEARFGWDEQRQVPFSQTARDFRSSDRELFVMRNKRSDIERDENITDQTRQLMLDQLDAEMERLAVETMLDFDRITYTTPK
ncbi:unnamed protein product, partial [marine sediment metagenome]